MRKFVTSLLAKSAALSLALVISAAVLPPSSAGAAVNTNQNGVALRGFDPVAYTSDGTAMMGRKGIETKWRGVTYRFASAFNRSAFMADPDFFLAQFDSHCAFGAAMGQKIDADPTAWTAHDGKIYLFSNQRVKGIWRKNPAGNIARAETNWPSIR